MVELVTELQHVETAYHKCQNLLGGEDLGWEAYLLSSLLGEAVICKSVEHFWLP